MTDNTFNNTCWHNHKKSSTINCVIYLQIEKEGLKERYAIEINTRDEEIETLRDIIKKNKKLNIPVVIATSVAVGFGVGFGTYHLASR